MSPDWQGDILKRIPQLNYHLEKKSQSTQSKVNACQIPKYHVNNENQFWTLIVLKAHRYPMFSVG